ncbi:RNA demethylase ALKBH5, partial [Ananas comosus]
LYVRLPVERTYSEPDKWMRGKGRVTIQFGCCYNYAKDKEGNLPGILRHVVADPIPDLFKVIIRRLIRWHVLPPACIPDSCIVNIYEPGDCIPPHIDSHDFVRPFCTVSFLSECNILFGSNLKIAGPGEFTGSSAIPLPVGSVLVMNGNGADLAKHCVPAVPTKRISITFRKMDETKRPIEFIPEPDLQNIVPLPYDSGVNESPLHGDKGTTSAVQDKREERGRDLAENSIESESKSDSQGTQLHRCDGDEHIKWSTQGRRFEEGTGSVEDNRQYADRRVRIDQRNIIVSRNFNQGEQAENRTSEPTGISGIHV